MTINVTLDPTTILIVLAADLLLAIPAYFILKYFCASRDQANAHVCYIF